MLLARTNHSARTILMAATVGVLAPAALHAATIGFNQTAAGPWDYNTPGNWVAGEINGLWDDSLTLEAGQTVTFGGDTVLSSPLAFRYAGNQNLTLRSDGAGNRTVTLGGDILVNTANAARQITFGSASDGQFLHIDLGGAVRTIDVRGTSGSSNARSLTFVNDISNGGLVLQGGGTINLNHKNPYTYALSSLTLRNTSLSLNGDSDVTVSGALTIDGKSGINGAEITGGSAVLSMASSGSRNHTFTASSLVRVNQGAVLFRGTNLGSDALGPANTTHIVFTEAPTAHLVGGGGGAGSKNISILPWAVGSTSATGVADTFVTYGANGIRPLDPTAEFDIYEAAFSGPVAGTDRNVRVAAGATVEFTGNNTVNALFLGSVNSGSTLNGDGTLTVTSGAVFLAANSTTTINVDLDFGDRQGAIGYWQGKGTQINGAISGTQGLVLYQPQPHVSTSTSGTGVSFGGDAAASTYTGDTYVLGRATLIDGLLPSGDRTGDLYVYGNVGMNGGTLNGLNGTGDFQKAFSGTKTFVIGGNDANGDFSGRITQNGMAHLTKIGAGTQILGGDNTYTGNTTVNGGALIINGSIISNTTVNTDATLGGSGLIAANVTINDGGTLAPGSSPGTLEITGNLTLADGALFTFELGADQASSDSVTVGGQLLLNGQEWDDFTFILPGAFASQYVLFDAASLSGALGANVSGALGDGITGTISVVGDDVVLAVVPEPASLGILSLAGLLLGRGRRRR